MGLEEFSENGDSRYNSSTSRHPQALSHFGLLQLCNDKVDYIFLERDTDRSMSLEGELSIPY